MAFFIFSPLQCQVNLLLLLLSHFSRVRLCATPERAAHQAPPSLRFSRQEHWSGLPFPSPVHESEKWKWSRSVVSDSSDPMDCSPPGSSIHGIFQAKVLEWGAIAFSRAPYFDLALERILPFFCYSLSNTVFKQSILNTFKVPPPFHKGDSSPLQHPSQSATSLPSLWPPWPFQSLALSNSLSVLGQMEGGSLILKYNCIN